MTACLLYGNGKTLVSRITEYFSNDIDVELQMRLYVPPETL